MYFIFLQNINLILTEKCRDNQMCIFPVLLVSPELYLFALGFIPWYACAWQSHICKYMLKLVWFCLHIASVDKSLLRRMQLCAVCRNIAQNCDAILSYNAILPYCPALIWTESNRVSAIAFHRSDSPRCSNQVFHLVSLALSIRSITQRWRVLMRLVQELCRQHWNSRKADVLANTEGVTRNIRTDQRNLKWDQGTMKHGITPCLFPRWWEK